MEAKFIKGNTTRHRPFALKIYSAKGNHTKSRFPCFASLAIVTNCKANGEEGTERSLLRRHRCSFVVVGRVRHNACKFPNTGTGAMHAEKKRNFGKHEEKPGKVRERCASQIQRRNLITAHGGIDRDRIWKRIINIARRRFDTIWIREIRIEFFSSFFFCSPRAPTRSISSYTWLQVS